MNALINDFRKSVNIIGKLRGNFYARISKNY